MKISTEPKIFLIGQSRENWDEIQAWMAFLEAPDFPQQMDGMHGEFVAELAGRRCYKAFADQGSNLNLNKIRKDSKGYHRNVLSQGHGSIYEHVTGTFAIELLSRVCMDELNRHRAGVAISCESGRFVRTAELTYWIPPEIDAMPEARAEFIQAIQEDEDRMRRLAKLFEDKLGEDFHTRKKLTSSFRRTLGFGYSTGGVWTFNTRALRHILEIRSENGAEVEIRQLVNMLADRILTTWPYIFQDFHPEPGEDGIPVWVPEFSKV